MKIVILNSSDSAGGAAIASRRLAQALVKAGAKTTMLVQDKRSTEPYIKSTTNRLFFYLRFLLERLSFVPYEKSKKERFWFSTASLGQRIDKNPYVRNADIIHIHWINSGFLSFKSIQKILELNTPIVWTLHDSWIFTGGCHLTRKCNHYENNCGNCPLLKSPGDNDLSHKLWKKKI